MSYRYDNDEYREFVVEVLDAIRTDQSFLRNRYSLEHHALNNADLKVAQDLQHLSGILIEEIKKAADSENANSDTNND